ncbi:MAG: hypothetical protein ACT4N5_03835 [Nitrosopumilaceae archaeon]
MFKIKMEKKFFLTVITVISLAGISSIQSVSAFSGAIYTTDVTCTGVNVNQFATKADVYLDGGPIGGGSGIPDGEYYVQVTEPDGALLGTSIGSADDTPAVVTGGTFAECYRLIDILIKASDGFPGFDDTTNGGGVYKVWVSSDSGFVEQKTDNFKVEADVIPPPGGEGSITLVKDVQNNFNGDADENDFGLTIGGTSVLSGETLTFPTPVDKTIDEVLLAGYEFVDITGDVKCPTDLGGTVSLADGDNITCIITNRDIQPCITLIKNVINHPSGLDDKNPDDFNLTIDGNPVLSGIQTCVNSNTDIPIDETQIPGFEFVDITGDVKCPTDLGGTVNLDEGENISCTITNRDIRGKIAVFKFYDANANGIFDDPPEPQLVWKVNVDSVIQYTFFAGLYPEGDYVVFEYLPIEPNWLATTPTIVDPVTVVTGETTNVKFGNLCFAPGGGMTLGFWSNKNGQALYGIDDNNMIRALNLRSGGGADFDPALVPPALLSTAKSQFRSWILSASATNMAYMLSAQLAAMELNVFNGKVDGNSLIYAPGTTSANALGFATVNAIMNEANAALLADGLTLAGDPNRPVQTALKNALDNANNNKNFVSPTPCAFSFVE